MQLSVNPVCKTSTLNESPSEKEGKLPAILAGLSLIMAPQ